MPSEWVKFESTKFLRRGVIWAEHWRGVPYKPTYLYDASPVASMVWFPLEASGSTVGDTPTYRRHAAFKRRSHTVILIEFPEV